MTHAHSPRGFDRLVRLLLLIRNATDSSFTLMPRELMFILFENLLAGWTVHDSNLIAGPIPPSNPTLASSSSSSSSSSSLVNEPAPVRSKRRCLLQ